MDDPQKPEHIQDLKDKLDSKAGGMILRKRQGVMHDIRVPMAEDWDRKNNDINNAVRLIEQHVSNSTNMFKKFFIGSIIFFIFAVVFSLYIFLGNNNTVSSKNVDITVVGSAYTAGGESLPLQILIANKNPVPLELVDLFIEYPKGTSGDATGDTIHTMKSVGTIDANGTVTIPITPVLYGEQGATEEISFRLEYHTSGSNAIFTKESKYGVTISTAPLSLAIDGPTQASSNEKITFKIKVISNAKNISSNMRLGIDYPIGFQFESSEPAPLYGNAIWDLGDLSQNQERDISVTGTITGVDGDQRTFLIKGGSENATDKTKIGVIYNSLIQTVLVQKAFIGADIAIDGSSANPYTTMGGTPLHATLSYQNNLPVRVTDVQISAHISGNAFDKNAVTAQNGFYDATTGTITWSRDTVSSLASLNPSDKKTLDFMLTPLPVVQQLGSFITNPQIHIDISIKGKQPSEGNASQEVNSVAKKTIQIGTDFNLASKVIYSTGPFTNSGPVPPQAGRETTYTVTWTLKNTANSVSGAMVSASLPVWADFVGQIYPTNQSLAYDQTTRNLVWNIGTVDRGTGFGATNREVSFQVKFKAGASQVGSQPVLVNAPKITGTDTFTGDTLSITRPNITTGMTSDAVYTAPNNGVVVQ